MRILQRFTQEEDEEAIPLLIMMLRGNADPQVIKEWNPVAEEEEAEGRILNKVEAVISIYCLLLILPSPPLVPCTKPQSHQSQIPSLPPFILFILLLLLLVANNQPSRSLALPLDCDQKSRRRHGDLGVEIKAQHVHPVP